MREPNPVSDPRYVQLYLDILAKLQSRGYKNDYREMADDILSLRHTLRNMIRRRNQVRFCNALSP